jgi:hypothetical protein
MLRIVSFTLGVVLVVLFAASLWLRTTSLETLPVLDGDEAWHAIQFAKMIRGEPFSIQTATGIPLSPFHTALEFPLLLAFPDSLWVMRVPPVITGVLAIVITYWFGARMLDRTTGLFAATLLAVVPVAIIYARTGYEGAHSPLYNILLIDLAAREKTRALIVLFSLVYFVHPMNVFLLPVLLALLVARSLERGAGSLAQERRSLLVRMTAVSSVVLVIGLFTLVRPITNPISSSYEAGIHGDHDPLRFLALYGRLLLGIGHEPRPVREWCFWIISLGALAFGMRHLVRNRQWDRVALIVGLFGSLAALFLFGSTQIIEPGVTRYGLCLVVPSVLALACLANSLLIAPTNRWRSTARSVQLATLLALGWGALAGCDLSRLTKARVVDGPSCNGEESVWTFSSEVPDPRRRLLALICDDFDRTSPGRGTAEGRAGSEGAGRMVIIGAGGWVKDYAVLRYLALRRGNINVASYEKLGSSPEQHRQLLREHLQKGAYAVSVPPRGDELDQVIQSSFPPEQVRRWDFPWRGVRFMTVYRLRSD